MRVAALQLNVVWEDRDKNFERVGLFAEDATRSGADLLVLPEMFSTGFSMNSDTTVESEEGPTVRFLKSIAKKNQMLEYENLQYQIEGLVQETYTTFNKRVELIDLEIENVSAAEQNLQLHEDRYELGTVSSLEFRDAQLNFIKAQTTLIVARFQARLSRLELDQLTGRLQIN